MTPISCILLVDDDATANFLHQSLLEDMGVSDKILVAYNGLEALEILQQQCDSGLCLQLILLDINMPVMNGFEFLQAYQCLEFSYRQSVVIVMLTTSLNPNDVIKAGKQSIAGYLTKPLTEEMVKQLLQTHFSVD